MLLSRARHARERDAIVSRRSLIRQSASRVRHRAAPLRMAVWLLVLGIFYGFRENPKLTGAAVFVGVAWSYALDGVMSLIYKVLPGMVMPFC